MFKKITIICIVLTAISFEVISQTPGYNVPSRKRKEVKEEVLFIPDHEVIFSFSYHTSSAYFNNDGKLVTDLPETDTTLFPGVPRIYTFDLKRYSFELSYKYFASKQLNFGARLPFTIYNLDEMYTEYIDAINERLYSRDYRRRLSHSRVDFLGFNTEFKLLDSGFINKYTMEVRIPTGFNDGVKDDPMEFWSDGALELLPGFLVGYSNSKFTAELGAKFNYRGEDMTDRVIGNLNFALHSVPGTRLQGFVEGAMNVNMKGHDTDKEVFDLTKMPWQDEYLDAGFGFNINFYKNYISEFSYIVRIAGKNAWNRAAYFITFSLQL
ncbi:MAG: hypothetical protein WC313_06110 [Candidatus Kapaibacterium sp.]|jgi:hypothetical protein|nr:hypothetical protein [Candidatus Kapabacteria bacterium]